MVLADEEPYRLFPENNILFHQILDENSQYHFS